jgi:hypothetical protein
MARKFDEKYEITLKKFPEKPTYKKLKIGKNTA